MTNAQRDENYISNLMAVDTNGVVKPLLVDPVTGRLKVNIAHASQAASATVTSGGLDENYKEVAMVWTLEDESEVRPLLCDSDGNILIDLIIE